MEKQTENKMILKLAETSQINQILELYKLVIEGVSKTSVNLGWNIDIYPNLKWITECVSRKEMLIFCEGENIIGACTVNYSVNEEYKLVDWKIKEPENKISTIHAFCVNPKFWGKGTSKEFLKEVISYCKNKGDVANHLDVIDTNDKAMKLYIKAGFEQRDVIEMFYECVGNRKFTMLEYVF